MSYPYKLILDEVEIRYDEQSRKYHITFHKIVENVASEPLQYIFARVRVSIFPEDNELTNRYYRENPLNLNAINFFVRDGDGSELTYKISNQYDSNIEFDLLFRDIKTGQISPLYQGQTKEVFYSFQIGDNLWGPYLQRHIRFPSDKLVVRFKFPRNLVILSGEKILPDTQLPIETPISKEKDRDFDIFSWNIVTPQVESKFRFKWYFKDERHLELEKEFKNRLITSEGLPAHSADFRSILWLDGQEYSFTATQAKCVKLLWEAWKNGTPDLGKDYIFEKTGIGSDRLHDIFKTNPAWRKIIINGRTKGSYRLKS